MAHVEKIHSKRTDLAPVTRFYGFKLGSASHAVACQFHFQQTPGKGCGINWRVNFFQNVANCSGMILMTMGDDDPFDFVTPLDQITEIWNDVVDTEHIILREHQAGIHDQNLVIVFIDHHIGAHFAQSA